MKKFFAFISILLFAAILAYSLVFAFNNNQPLELNFLIGQPMILPVAVWLGAALLLGVIAGMAAGVVIHTKHKLQIRALTKQLQKQNSRVDTI